jgi:hypothetical protein
MAKKLTEGRLQRQQNAKEIEALQPTSRRLTEGRLQRQQNAKEIEALQPTRTGDQSINYRGFTQVNRRAAATPNRMRRK